MVQKWLWHSCLANLLQILTRTLLRLLQAAIFFSLPFTAVNNDVCVDINPINGKGKKNREKDTAKEFEKYYFSPIEFSMLFENSADIV